MTEITIFDGLKYINKCDYKWFLSLNEDERKKLSPFMLMMWISFSKFDEQVNAVNEFVNPYTFSLYKHPDLLLNLLCCTAVYKSQKFEYRKRVDKHVEKKKSLELIMNYYSCNLKEAKQYIKLFNVETIVQHAEDMGYEKTDITNLKKEWK